MFQKIITLVLLAAATLSLNAQTEGGYRLESVTVDRATVQPDPVATPQGKPKGVMRTLFGMSVMGEYTYREAGYWYGLPVEQVFQKEGLLSFELMTPFIILKQSFSFNYLSSNELNNIRYQKTHINFLGLPRLGTYLDKYRQKSNKYMHYYELAKLMPVFDRRLAKAPGYHLDEMRIGAIFNMLSYTRTVIRKENASYKLNGQMYDGFDIELVYNKYTYFDMIGILNYIRLITFNNQRNGSQTIKNDNLLSTFLYSYSKIPNFYVNMSSFSNGKTTITDKNGKVIKEFKSPFDDGIIEFEIGVAYSSPFFIKKTNTIIYPEFSWVFYCFPPSVPDPRLNASIGIQVYF